jgi:hypothetical protein
VEILVVSVLVMYNVYSEDIGGECGGGDVNVYGGDIGGECDGGDE